MVFGRHIVMLFVTVLILGMSINAKALQYGSFIFSTYDIVFFNYEDGTVLEIYEKDGSHVRDFENNIVRINDGNPLSKGKHVRLTYPSTLTSDGETYLVTGSKKFSVLTGHITGGMIGYYAMDQNGRGVSTEFYTYVPPKTYQIKGFQKFVVFAYEDGTEATVEYADPNGVYREVVTNHPLDKGGHWKSENLSGKYIHVASNKPVSALSCYDTGYFVPSANGRWPINEYVCLCMTKSGEIYIDISGEFGYNVSKTEYGGTNYEKEYDCVDYVVRCICKHFGCVGGDISRP